MSGAEFLCWVNVGWSFTPNKHSPDIELTFLLFLACRGPLLFVWQSHTGRKSWVSMRIMKINTLKSLKRYWFIYKTSGGTNAKQNVATVWHVHPITHKTGQHPSGSTNVMWCCVKCRDLSTGSLKLNTEKVTLIVTLSCFVKIGMSYCKDWPLFQN